MDEDKPLLSGVNQDRSLDDSFPLAELGMALIDELQPVTDYGCASSEPDVRDALERAAKLVSEAQRLHRKRKPQAYRTTHHIPFLEG